MDVSKYVLTGVVIASFFKNFEENGLLIYGLGLLVAVATLTVGLLFYTWRKAMAPGQPVDLNYQGNKKKQT